MRVDKESSRNGDSDRATKRRDEETFANENDEVSASSNPDDRIAQKCESTISSISNRSDSSDHRGAKKHRIAMVCDFFYPSLGGVEMHIWSLSQSLIRRGHKVIVITHAYGKRSGVRYMTNGLKVYYAPLATMVDRVTLPTFFCFFPLFRQILIREGIEIVHCHQATSQLSHECILHAGTMGYRVVFTDHSLFGFADAASINVNKVLQFCLSGIDHAIAVSNTCRENLVLRASLPPDTISVIPNAIDPNQFTPETGAKRSDGGLDVGGRRRQINVVVVSRLVYRKGIDLLVHVIPKICASFPNVNFIIGGDGPKRLHLEEMCEKYQLHDRVEILGRVEHRKVREVLVRGHIFLNCSLTESFCIALLEAASCGLLVVSTDVGGVPEVLPAHMIRFAKPDVDDICDSLVDAFALLKDVVPIEFHTQVRDMYNWNDVSMRTEAVYDTIMKRSAERSIEHRLHRYSTNGIFFGPICCIIVALDYMLWVFLEWISPRENIEIAPDFPFRLYSKHRDQLHTE
eukprot:g1708.t1